MTFREEIQRQARAARREMVRTRELLAQIEFCARLGVSERRLAQMLAAGSVFSMMVDGVQYFPALLADPTVDRKRLQSVCRILVPAPPDCRLDYLSARQGNLGNITPLEALSEDKSYRWLREMARGWAAEWSRTTVKIYAGPSVEEPCEIEPTYVAVCEADPRENLWKRAMEAMEAGGYIAPPGPHPQVDTATFFVIRSSAGDSDELLEARLNVDIVDDVARVLIHICNSRDETDAVSVAGADNIVDVVHRIVAGFCRMKRR
ncbi:hypothetical protein [Paraburkholderia sediminicola]|uniref:hypothetical protein n=1 Tax=Paraburkholderia sediminicola TaxID=458836 RepID=UPI0038BB34C4